MDTAAAELRRVERDLHDGAQARLVALGMNLRAAERLIPTSPEAAIALVAEARETSAQALTELRDLVRGIYPPVLADRGLADAVRALALDTPLPAETDIDLPGRLDRAGRVGLLLRGRRGARQRGQALRRAAGADPHPARRRACCGSRSPTTAPAARTRPRAPGCRAWSGGWVPSTASWPSAARRAARP